MRELLTFLPIAPCPSLLVAVGRRALGQSENFSPSAISTIEDVAPQNRMVGATTSRYPPCQSVPKSMTVSNQLANAMLVQVDVNHTARGANSRLAARLRSGAVQAGPHIRDVNLSLPQAGKDSAGPEGQRPFTPRFLSSSAIKGKNEDHRVSFGGMLSEELASEPANDTGAGGARPIHAAE